VTIGASSLIQSGRTFAAPARSRASDLGDDDGGGVDTVLRRLSTKPMATSTECFTSGHCRRDRAVRPLDESTFVSGTGVKHGRQRQVLAHHERRQWPCDLVAELGWVAQHARRVAHAARALIVEKVTIWATCRSVTFGA